jgi:hyperosmotically inducible periplasmic protein
MRRQLIFSIALAAALISPLFAESAPQAKDLTTAFASSGVSIDGLRVTEVGGIVVIRGRATDPAHAAAASAFARALGYSRVANLVQITAPADDQRIARNAERTLAMQRGLDGARLRIGSKNGVVTLGGSVMSEVQKDAAVALVRNIDGVREVRTDFQ